MENIKKQLVGIIGHPIKHSLSPIMHNTAFDFLGLNYEYQAFDVLPENLAEVIKQLKEKKVKGFNVTIPHKVEVIKYLDEISEKAEMIGAVNTVVNKDGKLWGYNTDVDGFIKSLKEVVCVKGKKIVLLGSGGVARACVFALADESIEKLFVYNCVHEEAVKFCFYVKEKLPLMPIFSEHLNESLIKEADIIINATPVGLKQTDKSIVNVEWLDKDKFCMDLIYNPQYTNFLTEASEKGCKVLNGINMLVLQGASAFELWTEKKAPVELMKQTLIDNL